MSYLEQTMADLACAIPGATAIFHHYKLDFCCAGGQTLAHAAAKKGLSAEAIAAELEQLQTKAPHRDWRGARNDELIDYLQSAFHDKHRQQLPELIRMATRVEQVHGDRDNCPLGLADLLTHIQDEMELHMQKEEQILFPMLRQNAYPSAPIRVMLLEHDQHGDNLNQLLAMVNDTIPPAEACNTWRALYLGIRQFKEDLMQHIHLENHVLFVEPDTIEA